MTEFEIDRLGLHGDGVTSEGFFAPLTLPGEVVTGTVSGKAISDVRIVTPSPDRITPPCRHFKSCGGCQVQHGTDALVGAWKADVIRQALAARGLDTTIRPIQTSPAGTRRRAGFAVKRTKNGAMAGFHARQSDVIIEVPECQLVDQMLLKTLPALQELAIVGTSRKAVLSAMVTASMAGPDISVHGGLPLDGPLAQKLAQLCGQMGLARLAWDGEVVAMVQPPLQQFGKARVLPPPGAFLQATPHGQTTLLGAVRESVDGAARIVDLFAGCGTFALPLTEKSEVHAVEGDAGMLAAMDQGWRQAPGLKPLTTETRDLFRRPLLKEELSRFDAAVIDPPRAGAEAQVAWLIEAGVPRIAYVSCNPVTFARDAAALVAGGYMLEWVLPVDQFRWSAHVELAAQFRKADQ